MDKIAVVGAGMVGRAWAIVFARAGLEVGLYDPDGGAVQDSLFKIALAVQDLAAEQLIDEEPTAVLERITAGTSLGLLCRLRRSARDFSSHRSNRSQEFLFFSLKTICYVTSQGSPNGNAGL